MDRVRMLELKREHYDDLYGAGPRKRAHVVVREVKRKTMPVSERRITKVYDDWYDLERDLRTMQRDVEDMIDEAYAFYGKRRPLLG